MELGSPTISQYAINKLVIPTPMSKIAYRNRPSFGGWLPYSDLIGLHKICPMIFRECDMSSFQYYDRSYDKAEYVCLKLPLFVLNSFT